MGESELLMVTFMKSFFASAKNLQICSRGGIVLNFSSNCVKNNVK